MPAPADQLGKYQILEEIGRGGFATVYRALDTTLDREVALKVLDPLLMRDTAWVDRFRREARAVAALEHPHIVTVYEIAEAGERLFIAMKLVRGPDLAGGRNVGLLLQGLRGALSVCDQIETPQMEGDPRPQITTQLLKLRQVTALWDLDTSQPS